MAHDEALLMLNVLHDQLTALIRSGITALADNKMSAFEGMLLMMKASTLGVTVHTLIQGMTPAMRSEMLYVLEHGDFVLPPG